VIIGINQPRQAEKQGDRGPRHPPGRLL
jgi:hypothetical protein